MKIALVIFVAAIVAGYWAGRRPILVGEVTAESAVSPPAGEAPPIRETPSLAQWRDLSDDDSSRLATAQMWPAIEALSLEELIVKAREMASARSSDYQDQQLFRMLVTRWRDLDVYGLVDFVPGIVDFNLKRVAAEIAIAAIGAKDYARGLELTAELDDPRKAEASLIRALASTDPARAAGEADRFLAGAALRGVGRDFAGLRTREIAKNWAERNPEAAMAWASALENPELRAEAMAGAFGPMIKEDPAGVAAVLAEAGDESMLGGLAGALMAEWNESDPVAALAWARALPPGDGQGRALAQLAIASPAEAVALVGNDSARVLAVVRALGERSPEATLALLETVPPEQITNKDIAGLDWNAVRVSHDRVLALAANLVDRQAKLVLAERVIGSQGSTDSRGAADAAAAFPDPEISESLTRQAVREWGLRNYTDALEWVLGQPEGAGGNLFSKFVGGIASSQPVPVGETLTAHFAAEPSAANNPAFRSAIESVVGSRKPEAAAVWVDSLPAGSNRDSALRRLSQKWMRIEPSSREAWATGLSTEDRRVVER